MGSFLDRILPVAMLLILTVSSASGADPVLRGLEKNLGQFDPGILYGRPGLTLSQRGAELSGFAYRLLLDFESSSPSAAVAAAGELPYPIHTYLGAQRTRWREDVPHFGSVQYRGIYPGVDFEWTSTETLLNITVAPGASLDPVRFRLRQPEATLRWRVFGTLIVVESAGGLNLQVSAYQVDGKGNSTVAVVFGQSGEDSFGLAVSSYDPARPVYLGIKIFQSAAYQVTAAAPGLNGSVIQSGYSYEGGQQNAFLSAVSAKGEREFLTIFHASLARVVINGGGAMTALASVYEGVNCCTPAGPPVTPDAPRPVLAKGASDSWLGQFSAAGRLRSGTFTGAGTVDFAVDASGNVYNASPSRITKWSPGVSSFVFDIVLPGVKAVAAGARGGVAFVATQAPGQPVTAGAWKTRYEGEWDSYAGRLDHLTGSLQVATYVATIGSPPQVFPQSAKVYLAPDNAIWIASEYQYGGGVGHTLVGLNANASRVLYSRSVPATPAITFDAQENLLGVLETEQRSLPTPPDAPRRAGCESVSLYAFSLAPNGNPLNATYVPARGRFGGFNETGRVYVTSAGPLGIEPVDLAGPATPTIGCVINSASRVESTRFGEDVLITIVGNGLGPLIARENRPDEALQLQIAGIEVRYGRFEVPLVSVQSGLINAYLRGGLAADRATTLDVVSNGALIASTPIVLGVDPNFALFTVDGSGRGPAAALNQDGSVNSTLNPAKAGSVVSFFGTGVTPGSNPIFISGSGGPSGIEYDGFAPDLIPGVRQVNYRLPTSLATEGLRDNAIRIILRGAPNTHPPTTIFAVQ